MKGKNDPHQIVDEFVVFLVMGRSDGHLNVTIRIGDKVAEFRAIVTKIVTERADSPAGFEISLLATGALNMRDVKTDGVVQQK